METSPKCAETNLTAKSVKDRQLSNNVERNSQPFFHKEGTTANILRRTIQTLFDTPGQRQVILAEILCHS